MIKKFVDMFEKHKRELRAVIASTEQSQYNEYKKLFALVIKTCFDGRYDFSDITEIDYGNYQGTLILVFHEDTYQPSSSETFYTIIEYGSCSGCDTLLYISGYDSGIPEKDQVDDYMELCLEMVQEIKSFAKGWAE